VSETIEALTGTRQFEPHCLHKTRETAMERLIFICPQTRNGVDLGIESEIGTLLRIRSQMVRAKCPSCGQMHEWPVRDAWLATAA
jgi:hypothetical protein